jgi:hypothetical protein
LTFTKTPSLSVATFTKTPSLSVATFTKRHLHLPWPWKKQKHVLWLKRWARAFWRLFHTCSCYRDVSCTVSALCECVCVPIVPLLLLN